MFQAKIATPCIVSVCLFCLLFVISAPTFADGILDGNSNAVTFSAYSGSGSFDVGDLEGTLDYAVFTAAEFGAAFPSSTYSPTGAVVYAYQLENTGTDATSAQIVGVVNPASGIGYFEYAPGEQAPSGAEFLSGNAWWHFAGANALDPDEMSNILVFSSPNVPMLGASLTIDGGGSAVLTGVPTPSASEIPEPAMLALMILGGLCVLGLRRR